MTAHLPRVSHWLTLLLLATAVVIATYISDTASAQSTAAPRIIVDVVRKINALSQAGGYGYHTPSGIVQTDDIVGDHIYLRNMETFPVAEIWLRGTLPFSSLEDVSWEAVGANSRLGWSGRINTQEGHYLLRFAPEGGIEPQGVGEYVFRYKVGKAPSGTAMLTHTVHQTPSEMDQRQIGDDHTSAIWMSSQ